MASVIMSIGGLLAGFGGWLIRFALRLRNRAGPRPYGLRPALTAAMGAAVAAVLVALLPGWPGALFGVAVAMLVTAGALLLAPAPGTVAGDRRGATGRNDMRADGCSSGVPRRRLGRVAMALLRYVWATRRNEHLDREFRTRRAAELRQAMESGGVTFIKLGQTLSTRVDLFPPELRQQLARLQDDVRPVPWPQMYQVLRDELGGSPESVFAGIDQEPMAAASVAQVYRARLRSGADVVIKVQRPGIETALRTDLRALFRIANIAHLFSKRMRALGVRQLAVGFAAAMYEELDFRIEAGNIAAVRAVGFGGSANGTVMPHVYDTPKTRRLIVMERLEGIPLTADQSAIDSRGHDRMELARILFRCVLRQIVVTGVFHADPHPGNIMILSDGRIGLIDFGIVGRLDERSRLAFRSLLAAVELQDAAAVCDALLKLTTSADGLDRRAFQRAVAKFLDRYVASGAIPDMEMISELFKLTARFGLGIPPAMAAVARCLITMHGSIARLAPRFNMITECRRLVVAEFHDRIRGWASPKSMFDDVAGLASGLARMLRSRGLFGSPDAWHERDSGMASPSKPHSAVVVRLAAATIGLTAVVLLLLQLSLGVKPLVDLPPAASAVLSQVGLLGIGLLAVLLTIAGLWGRR
ncbi:AarF/UbiB family protein [Micromonospora sp. NPDC005220]|uniref:ABC1 kinase family protein n=1 Tax=Micromonospora sp. NPDC005220 TaxID=3155589 RepID=UPI0033A19813